MNKMCSISVVLGYILVFVSNGYQNTHLLRTKKFLVLLVIENLSDKEKQNINV